MYSTVYNEAMSRYQIKLPLQREPLPGSCLGATWGWDSAHETSHFGQSSSKLRNTQTSWLYEIDKCKQPWRPADEFPNPAWRPSAKFEIAHFAYVGIVFHSEHSTRPSGTVTGARTTYDHQISVLPPSSFALRLVQLMVYLCDEIRCLQCKRSILKVKICVNRWYDASDRLHWIDTAACFGRPTTREPKQGHPPIHTLGHSKVPQLQTSRHHQQMTNNGCIQADSVLTVNFWKSYYECIA